MNLEKKLSKLCMKTIVPVALLMTSFLFGQKVACVGNSLTHTSYPTYLNNKISYNVKEFGVPGTTMIKSNQNSYWNTQEFTDVKNWNPDYVMLLLATNDTAPSNWNSSVAIEFGNDYREFLTNFSGRVYLGIIPYVMPYAVKVERNQNVDYANSIIRQIASEKGKTVLEFGKALKPEHYTSDGIHLNSDGQMIMADVAYDELKKTVVVIPPKTIEDMVLIATYNETQQAIDLDWTDVPQTEHYRLNKAWNDSTGTQQLWWLDFYDDEHSYQDFDIVPDKIYFYGVEAFEYDTHKSPTIMFTTPLYLGIDDEYWEAVEDYEKQRKIGWFGCQKD